MSSRRRFFLSCIQIIALALIVAPPRFRAQENQLKKSDAEAQKEKEQSLEFEKKTVALLNDVASAAWSLKLPENRLFIMRSTAELLWSFDEKRARTLYREAINSMNSVTQPTRSTGKTLSKVEREQVLQAYMSRFTLRQQLLRQVAQRDAQLALEMLRATRQVVPQQLGLKFPLPNEGQLEQEIAGEVSARDPAHALQLARESLAKGFSFELLNLLQRLNQKDPEKGTEFAGDIIDKLRSTNVATDLRASVIAIQLLEESRVPEAGGPMLGSNVPWKFLTLGDEQKRDLVDLVTSAALSVSANSNLLREISEVTPEIQQFFPERQAALERKLSTFNETLTPQQRKQNTYNALVRRGAPEELVRIAANENDDTRLYLYQQAAVIAAIRGTTDSLREMVNKEVNDEDDQRKILDSLDAEEIAQAVFRKRVDHLKKLIPKMRRTEERARAMAELAIMLKEQGEDAEAVTMLDEAATMIKTDLKSETQTNALLSLLTAYAVVDPAQAFALAERTVDQANSQISMLMLLDRIVKSGAVKKSEIILEQGGIMPLSYIVFRYGKGVAALAKADFNRTRALADRFDRNELRVLARLLIVKGILTPPIPPPVNAN